MKVVYDFYKPEKKKEYLDSHPSYKLYFYNLGKFEKIIDTEALDFTKDNWSEAFKYLALNTKLFNSPNQTTSAISGFKGYLKANGKTNMSKDLRTIAVSESVFNHGLSYQNDRILTREEFLNDIIYKIDENYTREAGIYLCLYDGIRGKEYLRIRSILDKEDYFHENKVAILLDGNEERNCVTSETIKYLKKINDYSYLKVYRERINGTGFMFKPSSLESSRQEKTGMISSNTLQTAITKIPRRINRIEFNTSDVTLSGIVNCFVYAEYLNGKAFVRDFHFLKKVQKRYRDNVKGYYDTYAAYRNYKKGKDVKNLINEDFLDEMKAIIDEIKQISLTPEELAFQFGVSAGKSSNRGYEEGGNHYKYIKIKRRKPALIKEAKAKWLKTHKNLECEVCGVIPFEKYGEMGETAIEGHHIRPIKNLNKRTRLYPRDIRLLCSNCHSVIHYDKKNCMSINDLGILIETNQE